MGQLPSIHYRPFDADDAEAVHDLVAEVFDEFVAPLYVREGAQTFHEHIHSHLILSRIQENHFMIVAESAGRIVGVVEIRRNSHLSLLFVRKDSQGKGVARELLDRALDQCRRQYPKLAALTVNASPNAASAYERLGFAPTDSERLGDGIRYVPMAMTL